MLVSNPKNVGTKCAVMREHQCHSDSDCSAMTGLVLVGGCYLRGFWGFPVFAGSMVDWRTCFGHLGTCNMAILGWLVYGANKHAGGVKDRGGGWGLQMIQLRVEHIAHIGRMQSKRRTCWPERCLPNITLFVM